MFNHYKVTIIIIITLFWGNYNYTFSNQDQLQQDATLSQGVPRDAAVNFGATGIIDI